MTDSTIVEGCKKHQAKFQQMLLEKYSPILMATAMRYLNDQNSAKDALQETWIKVFNNIEKYHEEGKLGGWLKRILINHILKEIQKMKCISHNEQDMNNHPIEMPAIETNLNMQDMMKVIHTVPTPAKEVFLMHVIDGMSHKEIADTMGIVESTSRVHLTNARKYLRNIFTNSQQISI